MLTSLGLGMESDFEASGDPAAAMMDLSAMPSEIEIAALENSGNERKFSISESKVILRSLFPETWLFDLFNIGEMPSRFLSFAVTAFVHKSHLTSAFLFVGLCPGPDCCQSDCPVQCP